MTLGNNMLLSLVACVSCSLFNVITPYAQQQVYYIDDGRGQIQSVRGNPDDIQAEEWHIRLYKLGASTGGRDNWGLITGKSAQDVMRQLRASQEFQRRYAKWAGTDYTTEVFTHFNPLGPIAIIRPPKPPAARILIGLNKAVGTLKRLREGFTKIEQILLDKVRPNNPFREVGRVTQDYANALSQAEKMVASFQRNFTDFTNKADIELSWELERVAKSIEIAESKYGAVQNMLPNTQPASAQGKPTSGIVVRCQWTTPWWRMEEDVWSECLKASCDKYETLSAEQEQCKFAVADAFCQNAGSKGVDRTFLVRGFPGCLQ